MSGCKDFSDKIFFFDELSEKQKETVQKHLTSCEKCRKYAAETHQIIKNLKQYQPHSHFDDEILVRYATYLNTHDKLQYDGREFSLDLIQRISNHLEQCSTCEKRITELTNEWDAMNDFWEKSELPDLTIGTIPLWEKIRHTISIASEDFSSFWKNFVAIPNPKLIPVIVTTMMVFFIILISPSLFKTNDPYYTFSKLDKKEFSIVTRSSMNLSLYEALLAFNKKKYASAVEYSELFLSQKADDPDRAYAAYICGLSYLMENNSRLKNKLETRQYGLVNQGIEHLENAAVQTESLRLKEDIFWYLGKAYLMKKEPQRAIEYLEKVVTINGRKKESATELIHQVENSLIFTN